jgi:putative GTP pyrophosphokinase
MVDIKKIAEEWNREESIYKKLGEIVQIFISTKIAEYEILPEIQHRIKTLLSLIKKAKKKYYSYDDIGDKLGVRIICSFQEELEIVDNFLKSHFNIINVEYKKDYLDFNKLDYVSNHYDVKLNSNIGELKKYNSFFEYKFEIQVRTLNQHAWSNAAHSLAYKQEKELPSIFKRKIYRLLSLYELSDDEFSSVNKALKESTENYSYSLLRKIEGKFYKFAKIDFDKEMSLDTLDIILSYFDDKDFILSMINQITAFISKNEFKIQSIFEKNKERYHEILYLSQPEILVIWYILQENHYLICDHWNNDFLDEDLEQIKTLWGSEI